METGVNMITAKEQLDKLAKTSLEHGFNFFDNSEIYGMVIAKALKQLNVIKKKIVVSNKIFRNCNVPNDIFESSKLIIEGA